MSDITPIHRPSPTTLDAVSKTVRPDTPAKAHARKDDRVELSNHARLLGKIHELPDIREGLVESVKAEIEAGRYETDERIESAIEALVEDLA
ncbi:MAG: flagellar biosynthesis anti-sigma factor FlgM [Phycisphaerales bacterium JB063]